MLMVDRCALMNAPTHAFISMFKRMQQQIEKDFILTIQVQIEMGARQEQFLT